MKKGTFCLAVVFLTMALCSSCFAKMVKPGSWSCETTDEIKMSYKIDISDLDDAVINFTYQDEGFGATHITVKGGRKILSKIILQPETNLGLAKWDVVIPKNDPIAKLTVIIKNEINRCVSRINLSDEIISIGSFSGRNHVYRERKSFGGETITTLQEENVFNNRNNTWPRWWISGEDYKGNINKGIQLVKISERAPGFLSIHDFTLALLYYDGEEEIIEEITSFPKRRYPYHKNARMLKNIIIGNTAVCIGIIFEVNDDLEWTYFLKIAVKSIIKNDDYFKEAIIPITIEEAELNKSNSLWRDSIEIKKCGEHIVVSVPQINYVEIF